MTLIKHPNKLFFLRLRFRMWRDTKIFQLRCALRRLFGRCERCSAKPAKLHDSRTMYVWNGKGRSPNAPVMLCAGCAEEHHAYWDGMWADYYSGLI